MRPLLRTAAGVMLIAAASAGIGLAAETGVITGTVKDSGGAAVEGAEVFLYDSREVRRPADFISAKTDARGRFSVTLPRGTYWAVARSRKGGARYGPLMPGDRHSGEPIEITLSGPRGEVSFSIVDLREAALASKKKTAGDHVRVQGRIIDQDGRPLKTAYVAAGRSRDITGIPDYLSAWTDAAGTYALFLPRGRYYFGAATTYPPPPGWTAQHEVVVTSDALDVDIILPAPRGDE